MFPLRCELEKVLLHLVQWRPGNRHEGEIRARWVEARSDVVSFRMKAAPDISSAINFPSLSSAAEDTAPKGAWGKKL